MPVTEAKKRANKKWNAANRERVRYLKNRSACKKFIKTASLADLAEIEQLIDERRMELGR